MRKKFRRVLSGLLAALILLSAVPGVFAAPSEDEITKQIRNTYKKALSLFGRSSFDGYCGSLINAQLYLLGITSGVVHNNGNEEYDEYCNQDVTSGGYRVCAYPAGRFTLREALMDITKNGTQDAYNILVGFQRTKSVAGKRYGHAVFIHGIFDGMVYFVESYDVRLNGTSFAEGKPIICSIEEFCEYYASTTVELDGVVEFGLKDYEDRCDRYSAYLTAEVTAETRLMSQPCNPEINAGSETVRAVKVGELLTVIGLYQNTEGEFWYQTEEGFLQADRTRMRELRFDDVTIRKAKAPTVLRKSGSFKVKGEVGATHNTVYTLRAKVSLLEGDSQAQALSATDVVEGREYSLAGNISKKLKFRTLDVGYYRYTLAAIVGNHYIQDGQLQLSWETVELWKSEFQVSEDKAGSSLVQFDAGEGLAEWNQTAVVNGDALEELPAADREGYAFLGWFTEDGQRVTAEYVPEADMTLTARWYALAELNLNWGGSNSQSRFVSTIGLSTLGCAEVDGTMYYFSSFGQRWVVLTEDGTVVN